MRKRTARVHGGTAWLCAATSSRKRGSSACRSGHVEVRMSKRLGGYQAGGQRDTRSRLISSARSGSISFSCRAVHDGTTPQGRRQANGSGRIVIRCAPPLMSGVKPALQAFPSGLACLQHSSVPRRALQPRLVLHARALVYQQQGSRAIVSSKPARPFGTLWQRLV